MLRWVVGLRLREIVLWVLHEQAHGLLAAEAIGLAQILPIDGAVGWGLLTACETPRAHVAELSLHGPSSRGQTKQECARDGGHNVRLEHGNLLSGPSGDFCPRRLQNDAR